MNQPFNQSLFATCYMNLKSDVYYDPEISKRRYRALRQFKKIKELDNNLFEQALTNYLAHSEKLIREYFGMSDNNKKTTDDEPQ